MRSLLKIGFLFLLVMPLASCGNIDVSTSGRSASAGRANKAALTNPNTGKLTGTSTQINRTKEQIASAAQSGNSALLHSLGLSSGGSLGPNPKATLLRPYFQAFVKKPVDGKVDPFRSNLARFAPHVEIAEESTGPEEVEKTPLEYFDTDSYKLVLIMSGTARAKALVVDPKGKSYIVQAGTKIGNHDGKIVSITSTEVRIEEPTRPPILKVLEPPIVEMEKELQAVKEY